MKHSHSSAQRLQQASRLSIAYLIIVAQLHMPLSSYGQVVADPNAGAYRPDVITPPNTNNVPVVNITTPNAAGVSRNQYNQFDVQQQGAILNNNATNSQTQLAGWIQSNPNFRPGQDARIILNEVTSGNPTMLQGYIEVAGRRAEVIVANPAGIAVNGGGFINAAGATLTTGNPIFNGTGNLEAFRVSGSNKISITGAGLDTSTADYTRIIARAVEVNSGIWAKDLTIATGTGKFDAAGQPLQLTVEDEAGQPLFAIDVAQLGGMYAGKIHLIGTEAGVGVKNAGHIGASVGQVTITADGKLVNSGTLNAAQHIQLQAKETSNSGTIYSKGTLTASAGNMINTSTLVSAGDMNLQAQQLNNQSGALIAAGIDTEDKFTQSGSIQIKAKEIANQSEILAAQNISVVTNKLNNSNNALIQSNQTLHVNTDQVTNEGGIYAVKELNLRAQQDLSNSGQIQSGQALILQVNETDNTGTIYTQGVLTLTSQGNLTNAGMIAAQEHAAVTVAKIDNQKDALIAAGIDKEGAPHSTGTLTLTTQGMLNNAGEISAQQKADLQVSTHLQNQGKLIAYQALQIQTNTIDNQAQGEIAAAQTNIRASDQITNRGLIDGHQTYVKAQQITNIGTGRLYGDHLAVEANVIYNTRETVNGQTKAGTIAARDRLDIGTKTFTNEHGALLYSVGDMSIGNALDATNKTAIGQVTKLTNNGSLIEAGGNLYISATFLENLNADFRSEIQKIGERTVFEQDIFGVLYDSSELFYYKERDSTSNTVGGFRHPQDSIDAAKSALSNGSSHWFTLRPSTQFAREQTILFFETGGLANISSYPADHPAWALFGASTAEELDAIRWAFLMDINERRASEQTMYEYTEHQYESVVTASKPGEITAGKTIHINGNLRNDKSRIIAGEDISVTGDIDNIVAKGESYVVQQGRQVHTKRTAGGRGWNNWADIDKIIAGPDIGLAVTVYEPHAAHTGSGHDVDAYEKTTQTHDIASTLDVVLTGTKAQVGDIPTSSLYKINLNPNSRYLIETDPRFTNHGKWLSSDYILGQLGIDVTIHKRLGDGFYEQQLIREQLGKLMGSRFLAGYKSDDEQYQALMNAGVTFAQRYELTVGLALTAEQMAQLTSDLVWLVSKEVTLPDGSVQTVLVPQVYLKSGAADFNTEGTLISANNVYIIGEGSTLKNQAGIAAREQLAVNGENIQNLSLGHLHGQDVVLVARQDIQNLGGMISADRNLALQAGRDIQITTTVKEGYDIHGERSGLGNTGVVYLVGKGIAEGETDAGRMTMQAGRDIQLRGALVLNNAAHQVDEKGNTTDGSTTLKAGRDLNISTVGTHSKSDVWNGAKDNFGSSKSTEHGSQIQTQGDLNLIAENDLSIRGSDLESAHGVLNAQANTINIEATENTLDDYRTFYMKKKRFGGSKSEEWRTTTQRTDLVGSSLSAQEINLNAIEDLSIQASDVAATGDVNLVSETGNVSIESGTGQEYGSRFYKKTSSGVFMSSKGPMAGKQKLQSHTNREGTYAYASQLSTEQGNINISAKEGRYTQVGSDLTAYEGDINIQAHEVDIKEAQEKTKVRHESKESSSMLSLKIFTPEFLGPEFMATEGFFSGTKAEANNSITERTHLVGSSLSADNINLQSTKDLSITASEVVATKDVNLRSKEGNITIQSGTGQDYTQSLHSKKKSGLTIGAISATLGTEQTKTTTEGEGLYAIGSMVGSLEGDVNINAQEGRYTQVGSDLSALKGDVNVLAQDIDITEARETRVDGHRYEYKKAGVTVAISAPVISVLQTAEQMHDASKRTSSSRSKALAAGTVGLAAFNSKDDIQRMSTEVGNYLQSGQFSDLASQDNGPNNSNTSSLGISVSIGSSQTRSEGSSSAHTSKGSSIFAGNDINLVATGKAKGSEGAQQSGNLTIRGSDVAADKDINLFAKNDINILASADQYASRDKNKSSSGSIGVTYNGSWSFQAGMSQSKGKSHE